MLYSIIYTENCENMYDLNHMIFLTNRPTLLQPRPGHIFRDLSSLSQILHSCEPLPVVVGAIQGSYRPWKVLKLKC